MPPRLLCPKSNMANPVIKAILRTRFGLTSRASANTQTEKLLTDYLRLAQGLDERSGSEPVTVPPMLGVDEDMRGWSFFMILRHNTMVNNSISANIRRLALGEPASTKRIDPKKDFMPAAECGIEQIAIFKASILTHLESVKSLGELRGTETSMHPLFGPFDAHKWNCMFAFHLKVHLKQAEIVRGRALAAGS